MNGYRKIEKPSNKDGVIIKVYVESSSKKTSMRRPNPSSSSLGPRSARTRSQLLSHVQQLRHADPHDQQQHEQNDDVDSCTRTLPKPRTKKWKWSFHDLLNLRKRRWNKYHKIVTDETTDGERKARGRRTYYSRIYRKLRSVLKELSCGFKCNKC